MGVEVLALSTNSRFDHRIWQEIELKKMLAGGVPYAMLCDAGGRIGRIYGVLDDESSTDLRGRFIIDPDGVIQAQEILTAGVGRNPAEMMRQVQAFQHVRKTGEVTPSGWYPGKKTLRPRPELSGNVWQEWKPEEAFEPPPQK